MISKVFHDFSMIFQGTLWSPWSPSIFELVQNSLSVVFEKSGLSMNAQRSLNECSTVSPVFQWSLGNLSTTQHFWWIFRPNGGDHWSRLAVAGLSEISAGLSEILVGLSERTVDHTMNFNGLCKVVVCLSTNAERSPRSLSGLRWSPWKLLKIEFLVPQWALKDLQSVSTETTFFFFGGGGGGLGDCWEIWPSFGRSMVAQWSPFCGKGAFYLEPSATCSTMRTKCQNGRV